MRPATPSFSRGHLADEVFELLAASIVGGEMAPGTTLAPERELSERFGVSRLLVRQAVHRLAEIGLCRVRQGGATIVCDPSMASHPSVAVLALRLGATRSTSLLELYERQVLGAVPLLILAEPRTTKAHAKELTRLVDAHAGAPDDLLSFEDAFWTFVADIGDNSFIKRDTRFWFSVARTVPGVMHPAFGEVARRLMVYRELVRRLETRGDAASLYLGVCRVVLDALRRERAREGVTECGHRRRTGRAKPKSG